MQNTLVAIAQQIDELCGSTEALCAFVITPSGELLAVGGDASDVDTTALAQRSVAQLAEGTDTLATLRRERGIDVYDAEQDVNAHFALLSRRVVLVVIFDERSSLDRVRLAVRGAAEALAPILRAQDRFEPISGGEADS